ncbi:hypothetical protein [Piscirickettsia salmonis]|nr:hypothetical protein [Piscirickettsia salmonis]WGZ72293.1 hypothetical protein E3220_12290 [Piscirickettsia salmonis EM-90]ALA23558.1 sn-glycerol-3-phosphate transporter [Piscirickettsia salmonis]APS57488.1 hypothetical protein AVI52_09670 [Piscirickettsia salmonis]QGO82002.1 hypothetical protein Psal107_03045 [Piscirickettsia salmonis]QGP23877.1 hypothetical protein Psal158_03043 [Piscirickettsia salmonis]
MKTYRHMLKLAFSTMFKKKVPIKEVNIKTHKIRNSLYFYLSTPFEKCKYTPIELYRSAYFNNLSEEAQDSIIREVFELYQVTSKMNYNLIHVQHNIYQVVYQSNQELITEDNAFNLMKDYDIIQNLDENSYSQLFNSAFKNNSRKIIHRNFSVKN